MRLAELIEQTGFENLTPHLDAQREVTSGYCCDLLSWVMARGRAGMAWVTVQTHMNVAAVASLHDMACIILSENNTMPEDVLQKAAQEGVAVLRSSLSGYAICGLLYALGVR